MWSFCACLYNVLLKTPSWLKEGVSNQNITLWCEWLIKILIKISQGGKLRCHILSQHYKKRWVEKIGITLLDPLNSDNKPTIRTMKTFLLFLLTIVVVTSAPYVLSASDECKLQRLLLQEIIEHVNDIRKKEVKKVRYITFIYSLCISSAERFNYE